MIKGGALEEEEELERAAEAEQRREQQQQQREQEEEEEQREVREAADITKSANAPPLAASAAPWHRLALNNDTSATSSPLLHQTQIPPNPGSPASPNPNNHPSTSKAFSPFRGEGNMLAIRSGIPLALQGRKRRRGTKDYPPNSSGPTARKRNSTGGSKKGDLGVRKDLTLPTAPTAEEDNVFQSEDSLSGMPTTNPNPAPVQDAPIFELTIHGGDSVVSEIADIGQDLDQLDQSNLVLDEDDITEQDEMSTKGKTVNCIECAMTFSTPGQLRQHVK